MSIFYTFMESTTCCKRTQNVICAAKPALRFQYGKNKRGQWYWHIRAKNGEIIAEGEGYKRVLKIHNLFDLLHEGCGNMSITNLSPLLIPTQAKKPGQRG